MYTYFFYLLSFLANPEIPADSNSLKDNNHNEIQSSKDFPQIQSEQNTENNTASPPSRSWGLCPDGSCSK